MKKLNKYIILIFLFFISILFFIIHIQKNINNKNELEYITTKIDEFSRIQNIKEYGDIKYESFDINYKLVKNDNKSKMEFTVNNNDITENFTIYKIENIYYLYVDSEDKYIQLPNIFNQESKSIYVLLRKLIEDEDNINIQREGEMVNLTIKEEKVKSDIITEELKKYEQAINSFSVKNKNEIKSKFKENESIYSIDMKVTDIKLNVNIEINGIKINNNILKSMSDTIDINIVEEKIVPLEEYLYIH